MKLLKGSTATIILLSLLYTSFFGGIDPARAYWENGVTYYTQFGKVISEPLFDTWCTYHWVDNTNTIDAHIACHIRSNWDEQADFPTTKTTIWKSYVDISTTDPVNQVNFSSDDLGHARIPQLSAGSTLDASEYVIPFPKPFPAGMKMYFAYKWVMTLGGITYRSKTYSLDRTSSTTISDATGSSVYGSVYMINAVVTGADGSPSISGNVVITDGTRGGSSCTAVISNGSGSCNLFSVSIGSKNISGVYQGDASHDSSTASSIKHTVTKADSSVVLGTISPEPSVYGQAYTVNGTMESAAPSLYTASGTVTIGDGTNTCTAITRSGWGYTYFYCDLPSSAAGTVTLSASYPGDTYFNSSTASAETHTISKASTTVSTLTDSIDPTSAGQSYTAGFSVTSSVGTPTGSVTVSDGTDSCTGTLTSGSGSCNLVSTTAGSKTLSATYNGSTNYDTSSKTTTHTVIKTNTTTSIISSLSTTTVTGAAYTVAASVTAAYGYPAGTVTFSDGADTCVAALSSGSASCSMVSTSAGIKTITANYPGNAGYNSSSDTGTGHSHTVNPASTSTSITSDSPDPSVTGQSYTAAVTVSAVSPGSGYPIGSVTVSDTVSSCTIASLVNGAGSCSLASTSIGSKTLTASYAGSSNYSSSSGTTAHTVNKAVTATTISANTSTATVFGQNYAVNVSTVSVTPGAGTPTGSVTVGDGTNTCTAALTSGSGTCNLPSTLTGTVNISASYGGDANFNSSSASTKAHTISKTSTTVSLTDSNDPSKTGQGYTVSFTVSAVSPGTGSPTGSVTVSDALNSCTSTLTNGSGSCSLASSTAGSKTLTAVYAASTNFLTSSFTTAHTVDKADTTTAITSSTSLSTTTVTGAAYTVAASVTASSPGAGYPGGTVTFSDGSVSCSGTLSLGAASCSLISTSAGSKTITASYAGSVNYNNSGDTGTGHGHTVGKASTSTTITADTPDPSVTGQPYTVSFTVAAVSPGSGYPDGSVTISDAEASCSGTLTNGSGSCALTSTSAGTKTLTATYGTSSVNYLTSSGTTAHTVNKAGTSTTITSDTPDPSVIGQNYPVNVQVSSVSPGSGTPAGTVTVADGTNTCTVTLASGTGFCNLPSVSTGSKTISASYVTSSSYNSSSAATAAHTVNKANSSSTIVSALPEPSVYGQNYTITAGVAANSPGSGTPTGSVRIGNGTTTYTASLASGSASYSLPSGNAGDKTITSTYTGSTLFNTSTAATYTHTVSKAGTTTAITTNLSPATVTGQSYLVSFTTTVVSPGTGIPTGSVTVSDGSQSCTNTLADGSGSCSLISLSVGENKSITAAYFGSSNFNTSTSSAANHTVLKAASTITIVDDPNPSEIGSGFTVTATVKAASPGGGTPTGKVTFTDDESNSCIDVTLVSGSASCVLPDSANPAERPFDGSISVTYSGDDNYDAVSTPTTKIHTYAKLIPHLSITSTDPVSTVTGESYTVYFSAAATLAETSPIPTGSIVISDANGAECSGVLLPFDADSSTALGSGSCSITSTTAGSMLLTADYAGEDPFAPGKTTASHTVNKGSTTTTISKIEPAETVKTGETYTVSASVSAESPAAGTPGGEILISDGEGSSCTITLAAGAGSCDIATFVVGKTEEITVTAEYKGDENYKTSNVTGTHDITRADTVTTITSISPEPGVTGEKYAVSVSVAAVSPGSGTPNGKVTVGDGGSTCDVTLSSGAGTCTLEGLEPGAYTVSADYLGDDNYLASFADGSDHTVNKSDSSVSFTTNTPASSVVGEDYTVEVSASAEAPGSGVPSGSVTVSDSEGNSCTEPITLSAGKGSCTLPSVAAKDITLTALYSGDDNFNTISQDQAHVIQQASTKTSITADETDPTVTGQPYTITVSVETVSPGKGTPGSTVIVDDGSDTCQVTLEDGSGSCDMTSSTAGSKTITASYQGTADFAASSTDNEAHTVNKAATSTSILSHLPNPLEIGYTYTVSVKVSSTSPGSGTPGGNVSISNEASSCSAILSADEKGDEIGSCDLLADVKGIRNIAATYVGDINYASSSDTAEHTITNLIPTLTITSTAANPSVTGQPYRVDFSVTHVKGIPSGTVTIDDGSKTEAGECTGTLNSSGTGFCSLTSFIAGELTLSGSYSGSSTFTTASANGTQQVDPAETSTAVISISPSPAITGQPYTVSASTAVTSPGSGTLTGTITVDDGLGASCVITLESGKNDCQLSSANADTGTGSHTITAVYSGDDNYNTSTKTASQVINPASTLTRITSFSPEPTVNGETYTVNVEVTALSPSSGTPTGEVSVSDGTNSCAENITLLDGKGSCSLTTWGVGKAVIEAQYAGNNDYKTSMKTETHAVDKAETTLVINSVNPDASYSGQPITVGVSVSAKAPGSGTPTGTVLISDGSQTCTITLAAGSGECEFSPVEVGIRDIEADYSGDSNFNTSTETASHTFDHAETVVSIDTITPEPSFTGQAYVVSVSVSRYGLGSGTPEGTVAIDDGQGISCNAALTDGTGSCSLTSDLPDTADITAEYSGSNLYHTSSNTTTHEVIMEDTLTSITSSLPNPSSNGEEVFFTVKVETVSTNTLDVPGTVDLKEGSDTLCTGSTVFGTMTCSTSSLENGGHTLYAVYSGQANKFISSESDTIEQVVGQVSLDDNKTSTSFTTVGEFSTVSGSAPYTYSLQDNLRLCTAVSGANNDLFEISGNSLLRKEDTPAGDYTICVQSQDDNDGIVLETFNITINDPPLLTEDSLSNKNMDINHELIGTITAEAGQAPLLYTLKDSGPVCTAGNSSGNEFFTIDDTTLYRADATPIGSYDICVEVSDGEAEISQYSYTINITNPPSALDLTRKTVSTQQDVVGTWIVTDGQTPLNISLSTSGGFCNANRGQDNDLFRIKNNKLERLADTAAGEYSICAQVFDSNNAVLQVQFTIYITDPPTGVTLSNNTVTVNQQIVGTLDTDLGQFIYHYHLMESGSECNATNGKDIALFRITGNALERLGNTTAGSYDVCIQSTDANDEITQTSFSISVTDETIIPGKLTASLTANQLIDGDTSGTVAGSLVSSISETVFSLVDLDKFPLAKFFDISIDNHLLVNTTVDITQTPFFPIRILAAGPKGEKQYIDAVISVMKNGAHNDSSALDDYGQVETYKTVEIDILSNDKLSKGASSWVSHQIVTAPLHGTAVIGSIIYTPDKNYKGSDVITYRACDNLNYCVIGNVLITVLQRGSMPETGFAPGIITSLPAQPTDSKYTNAGSLDLSIPALSAKGSIVGIPATKDGWELSWLGNGIGWLAGSAYPTWNGNSVLTGHVFNADGKPGIFASLGLLRWGDEVIVTLDGVKYTYEVREVLKSVNPYALNTMLEHKDSPWLTLVTCDGFDKSTNTYRYRTLVRAVLIHSGN